MKKIFWIEGMHCNSCAHLIENELKDKVEKIFVSYADEKAEIEFDENKITEERIIRDITKLGYKAVLGKRAEPENAYREKKSEGNGKFIDRLNNSKWMPVSIALITLLFFLYRFFGFSMNISDVKIPALGEKTSLMLLFLAGILAGFHCVGMCGGFVVSYTAKNALNGHKGFKQHLVYGGSKVLSYMAIGGIFGAIGGIIAFSIGLRSIVAILAGIFMIFYALSMFGVKFFRRFQFNPKFLTRAASETSSHARGPYKTPFVTGLLNGLFIACGPLQAMYLYATGTGSFVAGAASLAAFGLGTLPVMLGFGSLATVISHKTTKRILKISAVIVIILGLIMINRGLTVAGSPYNYDSVKSRIFGANTGAGQSSQIINGVQEINMNVDASGYSPNSFVLKKGVPVKWNVNVKQLTGCNDELVLNDYGIDKNLEYGMNVIEFTPDKTGIIRFSCGMGMIRGSFIVTETGQATQQEIKAATPSSGGSCGCGG